MNPNDLDLRLLRSFVVVAKLGKISTAAKQLHLSQPAVTAHLRRLEEITGKPVIPHSTSGVKLTTTVTLIWRESGSLDEKREGRAHYSGRHKPTRKK
jgi:molybdate transport repressor ModE-like protein